jgi:hypothetical protein
MYFLTVRAGDSVLCDRVPYADYAAAIEACGAYYEPKARGAVMNFTSEAVGKKFMRAYAQLVRLEDLAPDVPRGSPRHDMATKQGNAFAFTKSYTFLIESEAGVEEAERLKREEDDNE